MIRIGVLGSAEIAYRRFLPALKKCSDFAYVGVAVYSLEERYGNSIKKMTSQEIQEKESNTLAKGKKFVQEHGGKLFVSFAELIESDEIDAVYIPLPPAKHFEWAKIALLHHKHVFLEKPFTTTYADTNELLEIAKAKGLAVHENYMFQYHKQIMDIEKVIKQGKLGEIRLLRMAFGFPKRSENDFRYDKAAGGGALLDAGGYVIKYTNILLGETTRLLYAHSNYADFTEVDIFGSAAFCNDTGLTAQIAFGMDNSYKCELEIWGSTGCLYTGRIFTAPVGFEPQVTLTIAGEQWTEGLSEDDAFYQSIMHFEKCVITEQARLNNYDEIQRQACLMEDFVRMTNNE